MGLSVETQTGFFKGGIYLFMTKKREKNSWTTPNSGVVRVFKITAN